MSIEPSGDAGASESGGPDGAAGTDADVATDGGILDGPATSFCGARRTATNACADFDDNPAPDLYGFDALDIVRGPMVEPTLELQGALSAPGALAWKVRPGDAADSRNALKFTRPVASEAAVHVELALAADVRITDQAGYITVAVINLTSPAEGPRHSVYVFIEESNLKVGEGFPLADGGVDHPSTSLGSIKPDLWTSLAIELSADGVMTVKRDGQPAHGPVAMERNTRSPSVDFMVGIADLGKASNGFRVRFDNVLFETR